jgi:hypothetical protein
MRIQPAIDIECIYSFGTGLVAPDGSCIYTTVKRNAASVCKSIILGCLPFPTRNTNTWTRVQRLASQGQTNDESPFHYNVKLNACPIPMLFVVSRWDHSSASQVPGLVCLMPGPRTVCAIQPTSPTCDDSQYMDFGAQST